MGTDGIHSRKRKTLIYLIGMMGTGKSTVGKCLAERIGGDFIDLDQYIEQREQSNISEIFQNFGEAYFRELESSVIKEIANGHGQMAKLLVVATGGGAFERSENRSVMKKTGIAVWLRTTPENIALRLANDTSRPLLQGVSEDSLLEKIRQLLEQRSTHYRQADIHLHTDGKSVEDICTELLGVISDQLHK